LHIETPDRWPLTIGKVHWFDFLPDEKAEKDAAVLLQKWIVERKGMFIRFL